MPRKKPESLGARVKRLRLERGLTHAALAAPAEGISESYLSLIENDNRVPTRKTIAVLARRLGVPVHYLEYGITLGVYVLARHAEGGVELVGAFTDEAVADEWARLGEESEIDGSVSYRVEYVQVDNTEAMALFAADRLASTTNKEVQS